MVGGLKYIIDVYESVFAKIHNHGITITEIFIPSENIVFNSEGCVFASKEPRNNANSDSWDGTPSQNERPMTRIQLDEEFVSTLKEFVNMQTNNKKKETPIKKQIKEYFH